MTNRALSLLASAVVFLLVGVDRLGECTGAIAPETILDNDATIVPICIDGRPPDGWVSPQVAELPEPNIQAGINILSGVPAYDWCYGCSATSAAMMMGYYDRIGYPNMYTGPANGGVCPLDNEIAWDAGESPLSASHQGYDGRTVYGHVDDYWIEYGSTDPDPFIGNWTEHSPRPDCTGDAMGTNQSLHECTDGATWFYNYLSGDPLYDYIAPDPRIDGCHGMRVYAEACGYGVLTNFNQLIKGQGTNPNKGFTFDDYVAEIDAGRPVMIQITGHSMVGFGYDTSGTIVYIRNTWDHSYDTMTWGGTYSGMQHRGVTVFRLDPSTLAALSYFKTRGSDSEVVLEWKTEAEVDVAGFNVLRAESLMGPWVERNKEIIPSRGTSWEGASYSFSDESREAGTVYWYCVEEVSAGGVTQRYPAQMVWDEGLADADGDDMPDVWEQKQGIDAGSESDAKADADGDGATNLQEYLCGTSPTDAEDCPRLTIERKGAGIVLSWPGRPGRTYTVLTADSLAELLGASPTVLSVRTMMSNGAVQFEANPEAEVRTRFYRLVVSPPH